MAEKKRAKNDHAEGKVPKDPTPSEDSGTEQTFESEFFPTFPDFFEYLHNVIEDAHASGCVVHIVTLWPTHLEIKGPLGTQVLGCKPKAASCPK